MKNIEKTIFFLLWILLIIIIEGVEIVPFLFIPFAVVGVIYLLVLGIKYLFLYKERIITYKNFKSFLESQYRVTNNVQKNIELQLSNIVHDIFFRTKIPNSINDEFKKLLDELFPGFNSSSVWSYDVSDSNLESRKNVKFSKNEFLKLHEIYGIDNFTLSFRYWKLHFTPFVCFYEKNKNISIINWDRISIAFKEYKRLEEKYREIKGAKPIYYSVYEYAIYLVAVEKDEFNIAFANIILGNQFFNLINTYQKLFNKNRSQILANFNKQRIGVNNLVLLSAKS